VGKGEGREREERGSKEVVGSEGEVCVMGLGKWTPLQRNITK